MKNLLMIYILIFCILLKVRADDAVLVDIQDAKIIAEIAGIQLECIEAKTKMQIPYSQRTILQQKFFQAAFAITKTHVYISNVIKTAILKYPDLIVFDALLRFAKFGVLLPVLAATGYASQIPGLLVPLAIAKETADVIYVLVRRWVANRAFEKRFGLSMQEIAKYRLELFSNEDISIINRWYATQEQDEIKIWTLQSIKEVEDIIDDPVFIRECKKMELDQALYISVLLRKIMDDSNLRNKFLTSQRQVLLPTDDMRRNILEMEYLIDRIKIETKKLDDEFKQRVPMRLSKSYIMEWLANRRLKSKFSELANEVETDILNFIVSVRDGEMAQSKIVYDKIVLRRQTISFLLLSSIQCSSIFL